MDQTTTIPIRAEAAIPPAADPTECPGRSCTARYAHAHCSGCGEIINYQDGGRDLDGTQYYELPDDASFCSCGEVKHRACECALDRPSLSISQQVALEANRRHIPTVTTDAF